MARSLTVYIDGRCLLRPKDGVGSYVKRLLENILDQDTATTYIALGFADQRNNERLVAERPNFTYHFLPMSRKVYMGLFRVWQSPMDRFLPSKADAVWYPDFVAAPWIRSGKKILTIHDLTFAQSPDVVERKNLRYLRRFVPASIKRAAAITTVSYAMEHDIKQAYPSAPAIHVIYPAAPPETPGIPVQKPYILFVGTLQPRKNIKTLLQAYQLLPTAIRNKYGLTLAGRRGWKDAETLQLMSQTPHTWVESPPDQALDTLYAGASLFVLPSLHEGFGIPAVEALCHHVPVITSQDPALVEATGDAAMHVPATDPAALASAMQTLLTNSASAAQLATHRGTVLQKLDGRTNARKLIDLFM